jgi:hypothetical protein
LSRRKRRSCRHASTTVGKTGQDGLALARGIVEGYGQGIADRALQPLEREALATRIAAELRLPDSQLSSRELDIAIDDLLTPAEPPSAAPTPAQRQAGRSAIVEWMLTDPELDGLNERLGALLSACKADHATPEVSRAAEALGAAVGHAIGRGYDAECMREVLACWSAATGGPRIAIEIGSR